MEDARTAALLGIKMVMLAINQVEKWGRVFANRRPSVQLRPLAPFFVAKNHRYVTYLGGFYKKLTELFEHPHFHEWGLAIRRSG